MGNYKRLMISISDQPTYHGVMTLDFAIDFFGKKYPQKEVSITIFELCDDETIKLMCERKNGIWEDIVQ